MATIVDKENVIQAYDAVRDVNTDITWAVFKYDNNYLVCGGVGNDFDEMKSHFTDDDRLFAYVCVEVGDSYAQHCSKFVLLTWFGPQVSVIQRARMSTDKGLLKEIVLIFSKELHIETIDQVTPEYLRKVVQEDMRAY
ncbi:PREDICTED: coactosin-like protein isoform X1 [Priapulus caudatus]|uniref:Coactosin-like protein isoform X1 n=1 Tax=Priapulus caudatus TaxID=37621 RepID=A0ABM1EWP7_PRICU|nr:PREDICTED: coactosin-like protein isoform X1 [Priapulus caudatus]